MVVDDEEEVVRDDRGCSEHPMVVEAVHEGVRDGGECSKDAMVVEALDEVGGCRQHDAEKSKRSGGGGSNMSTPNPLLVMKV